MPAGKVLIILPSSRYLKLGSGNACIVGYHLRELAVSVKHLKQADYQLVIATPHGETPFVDPNSLCDVNEDERLFYETLIKEHTQLLLPLNLHQMSEEFLGTIDGLLLIGGFAILNDFGKEPALKPVIRHMHKHCKPTAAIGHGTLALAYALDEEESWAYKGYQMTCPPPSSESHFEALFKEPMTIHVHELLEGRGAFVLFDEFPDKGFILEDRELITGQDQSASKPLATAFVAKLDNFQKRRCC